MKKSSSSKQHLIDSYIKFWGTRGSSAVSGADYVRYGGNTCCLEVSHGKDLVIFDAGTGIRELGEKLALAKVKRIHLFLSHTHWDHITGFPFFAPVYDKGTKIYLYSPIGFEKTTEELFTEMLANAYFPVRLEEFDAQVVFVDLKPGLKHQVGKIGIETCDANHPGSTVCFKISVGKKKIGYATDNELLKGFHGDPFALKKTDSLIRAAKQQVSFFKGCDLLIHEAQYTPTEYRKRVGWGHSSMTNATYLVKESGASQWIVTHHDPHHTDTILEKKLLLHETMMQRLKLDCQLQMAYDGMLLKI